LIFELVSTIIIRSVSADRRFLVQRGEPRDRRSGFAIKWNWRRFWNCATISNLCPCVYDVLISN